MTEYTPLPKPLTGKGSTDRIQPKSADDRFREEIIVTTCCEWVKAAPQDAKDFITATREEKAGQRETTGAVKGKNRGNMYVKYKIPQGLLDCVRVALNWAENTYEMEFDCFGLDDKDMKLLTKTFPDLFKYAHNMTWAK